jgi:cytochrome b
MTSTPEPRSILVWDTPVRVFHWLLALCFFGAFVTAESERLRLLHNTLGYTAGGLVVFRLIWGWVGTRHARFSDFVRGPRDVFAYLRSLRSGEPQHHVGHNPAGALAILGLLGLTLLTSLSGWAGEADLAGEWLLKVHEGVANLMMGVVLVHLLGVVVASRLHHENLVASMFSGRKLGPPDMAIRRARHSVAVLMLAAVLGFWWLQWQDRPAAPGIAAAAKAVSHAHADDEHD